jgi:hypothetical protein
LDRLSGLPVGLSAHRLSFIAQGMVTCACAAAILVWRTDEAKARDLMAASGRTEPAKAQRGLQNHGSQMKAGVGSERSSQSLAAPPALYPGTNQPEGATIRYGPQAGEWARTSEAVPDAVATASPADFPLRGQLKQARDMV